MKKLQSGYLIIEILIAIIIISVALISLTSMISFLQIRNARSVWETDASLLLQEGIEATHRALMTNWSKYPDGSYYPILSADGWLLDEGDGPLLESRFRRVIQINSVCRNPSDGGKVDCSNTGSVLDTEFSRLIKTEIYLIESGEERKVIEAELLVLNQENQ